MKRQLVTIAGWLGCKPKSLKRYRSMYENLGCDVIIRIPSPPMVIHAAMYPNNTGSDQNNTGNIHNHKYMPSSSQTAKTIMDFAIETIHEIYTNQETNVFNYDEIYFHVFSNGGCFLWEAIYDIISKNNDNIGEYSFVTCTDEVLKKKEIHMVKSKLKGVIYDSSPAYYGSNSNNDVLLDALKFCSPFEQEQLQQWICKNKDSELYQTRALQYWTKMKTLSNVINNDIPLRSLYIYSKTDALTPFADLHDLVKYRQQIVGKKFIEQLIYEDSPHCSHILTDDKVYYDAIKNFVQSNNANIDTDKPHEFIMSRL